MRCKLNLLPNAPLWNIVPYVLCFCDSVYTTKLILCCITKLRDERRAVFNRLVLKTGKATGHFNIMFIAHSSLQLFLCVIQY
jgi:hypothetical protein